MKKPTPIPPMGVSINDTLFKRVARWLLQAVVGAALITLFLFVLIEWAAGCGESYVDGEGTTHINECVFISKP